MHIEHTGAVRVAAPLRRAFVFFTPAGERQWVPGWNPEYLHPPDGRDCEGAVFRTAAGGEETLWLIARFDPEAGAAEYVRVTPGSRMGTVTIRSEAARDDTTIVHVAYRLTSLSPEGSRALESFSDGFDAMLREWESSVASALGR